MVGSCRGLGGRFAEDRGDNWRSGKVPGEALQAQLPRWVALQQTIDMLSSASKGQTEVIQWQLRRKGFSVTMNINIISLSLAQNFSWRKSSIIGGNALIHLICAGEWLQQSEWGPRHTGLKDTGTCFSMFRKAQKVMQLGFAHCTGPSTEA